MTDNDTTLEQRRERGRQLVADMLGEDSAEETISWRGKYGAGRDWTVAPSPWSRSLPWRRWDGHAPWSSTSGLLSKTEPPDRTSLRRFFRSHPIPGSP